MEKPQGHRRIHLDNAATTWPKPEAVWRAVDRWQREVGVGPWRGDSSATAEAGRQVETARREAAALLGGDPKATVFTLNGTDALNMALRGLLRAGDRVVATRAEHSSVVRPLRALQEEIGVEAVFVPVSPQGRVDPAAVRAALGRGARMLVVSHASNVTGAVQPIEELGRAARDAGAFFLLDAAQTAGVLPLDTKALGADAVAAPGHKGLLGPQGTGVLCLREALPLRPLRAGGTGSSRALDHQPEQWPERMEAGTPNTAGILGLLEGLRHVASTGPGAILAHELEMAAVFLERLQPALRSGTLRLVGPPMRDPARVAVVSLALSGLDPSEAGLALDAAGIAVRTGFHCAPLIHEDLGTTRGGTLRVSPGPFTTREEVEAAADALLALLT